MKVIYLYPESTFKTILRSDTLWGILCWGIRSVYGNEELEKILSTYNDIPEFIISSAFPFVETINGKMHFFPKPIYNEEYIESDNLDRQEKLERAKNRKKIKKTNLLELSDFNKLINGTNKLEEIVYSGNKYFVKIESETITHNTIDRLKGGTLKREHESGQLFHIDEHYIETKGLTENHTAGLFFLIKGKTDKIEGALRFLNHVGYGGDRNTGKGSFKFKIEDFNLIEEPSDYNAYTNLSLYYPTEEELMLFKSAKNFFYQLEERQGFTSFLKYKKFYKPVTIMFKEGSVFPRIDKSYWGRNKIVLPQDEIIPHNIYQYGYGFMIKLNI